MAMPCTRTAPGTDHARTSAATGLASPQRPESRRRCQLRQCRRAL